MLERAGMITLKLTKDDTFDIGRMSRPTLKVLVDDRIKIVYDMFDGDTIYSDELNWSDLYFKRSFNSQQICSEIKSSKILPFGFYYLAYGPNDHYHHRIYWALSSKITKPEIKELVVQFMRNSYLASRFFNMSNGRYVSNFANFEQIPRFDKEPKIIFFARLWDPNRSKSKPLIDERIQMNENRVNIIKMLKREFGNLFMGGLERSDFTLNNYPDLLVKDKMATKKNVYLHHLRQASIGISTSGLLKSNGAKIAEYIAGSKAIVSEKLNFQVPGNFQNKLNYYEFSTVDECIDNVSFLVNNKEQRYEMTRRNFLYYQEYLRPDMLVLNSLKQALDRASA